MTHFSAIRPGLTRLGLVFLTLLGLIMALVSSPVGVAAQADYDMTTYGYFSDDGETALMLIHIEPYDSRLAAEFVSPAYADEFLQTIAILDEYWWAESLETRYRNQVAGADEYMVFEGELDFYDGWDPGYVMLLSVEQEIYMIAGYRADSNDLFELAEEVIDAEAPPRSFDEYTRENLDDDNSSSSNNNGNGTSSEDLLCYEDRALSVFDLDDDGVITIDELEEFAGDPDVDDVIDILDDDGYDGIEYENCETI
ncbi:MAG TPA: hypothetical protein VEW66_00910 [Thermomicrobiales bacterium]|nr:hypothetical protein [Thermomicrobiales bacterium]